MVAQKLLALSKAYVASTNEPSFSALWWLAMWLNVLMVLLIHIPDEQLCQSCLHLYIKRQLSWGTDLRSIPMIPATSRRSTSNTETIITTLPDPHGFSPDPLTDLLRSGARDLIQQAVEAELSVLLEAYSGDRIEDGRARLVRHGHLPEREVMTGIGAVPVKVPRVRDRGDTAEKVRFTSTILPPYLRKAKSIEELLPWLYLKGISTGDFHEALAALLSPNAAGAVIDDNFST